MNTIKKIKSGNVEIEIERDGVLVLTRILVVDRRWNIRLATNLKVTAEIIQALQFAIDEAS